MRFSDLSAHHVRAAARAKTNALLAADLPYHSYENPEIAVANARRLVAAGAEAVKAEGGRDIIGQVRAIVARRRGHSPKSGRVGRASQFHRGTGTLAKIARRVP